MTFAETLMGLALPVTLLVGAWLGKRARKHRHIWTPWSRVWDEAKQELTMVQERTCKGCGLLERNDPVPKTCPPHEWGKWVNGNITIKNGGTDRIVGGQSRSCMRCGIETLRRSGEVIG